MTSTVLPLIRAKILDDLTIAKLTPRDFRLVLCHGNFDLVHPGHLAHFDFARGLGDRLLVSVNDDQSCRSSAKGAGRPLLNEQERSYNLACLVQVDWIYLCRAPTPEALVKRIRPDVYVKGYEYRPEAYGGIIPEQATIEDCGGVVVFGPRAYIHSSRHLTSQQPVS